MGKSYEALIDMATSSAQTMPLIILKITEYTSDCTNWLNNYYNEFVKHLCNHNNYECSIHVVKLIYNGNIMSCT